MTTALAPSSQSFLRQVAYVDQPHLDDETTLVASYSKLGPVLFDVKQLGSLKRLERVETIVIDHNDIRELQKVHTSLPRLTELYLDWNALESIDASNMLLRTLETLSLTSNRIKLIENAQGLNNLRPLLNATGFQRLRVLKLSNNQLRNLENIAVGSLCETLEVLIVAHNNLTHLSDMVRNIC